MRVAEVRKLLENYREKDLRVLVVEMYKAMPKKLREEKDIDALLQDVQGFVQTRNARKTKDAQVDVEVLEKEINHFLDLAYQQCYVAPSRLIPKKERPKWRFKVTKGNYNSQNRA